MSFDSLLNQTCTIQTRTVTFNSTTGGEISTWANTYTSVPCRFQFLGSSEQRKAELQNVRATNRIYLKDYSLSPSENRITFDSINYQITGSEALGGVGSNYYCVYLERVS